MISSRSSPSLSLDDLLDLGDPLLGLLDARAGLGADVHLERAGVDLGEELAPQLRAEPDDHRDQQARRPRRRPAGGGA